WLGAGVSDHLDVLARADCEGSVPERARRLLAGVPGWAEATLVNVPAGSPLLRLGAAAGWEVRVEPTDVSPALDLAAPGAPGALASPGLLKETRYRRRRLARQHGMRVRSVAGAEVEPTLERLFELHRARWAAAGGP